MTASQTHLTQKKKPILGTTYGKPQYNKLMSKIQRIETHRGMHAECNP